MATKKVTGPEKRLTPTERADKAEAKLHRLETRVAKLRQESLVSKQVGGFVDFLREQSVVGLAIGLVLGTQAKVLVDQLVISFFNPITGLFLPGEGTLKQKVFTLEWGGKSAEFAYGAFISSLLTFVIVAAVVYYVFKGLRLDKLDKKKEGNT
ncbi:MAG TPA: MscL family protein [Candidatus Saccharimonadales bacterium]|nr:MscL family protein [Candidatus Saccharimonadales bacterium]